MKYMKKFTVASATLLFLTTQTVHAETVQDTIAEIQTEENKLVEGIVTGLRNYYKAAK